MNMLKEGLRVESALRLVFLTLAVSAAGLPCFAQTDLGSVHGGPRVRVALIGDFGAESKRPRTESAACSESDGCKCHWFQEQVANSLYRRHQTEPFDIGVTVGDNFYKRGVASTADSHWKCSWKRFYSRLGIVFYPTLGNHDYDGNEQAQIDYSPKDPTWNMPARYYTFQAGPVRFFALDTEKFQTDQLKWLDKALGETDARWKVVYGHRPVYSCSDHRDTKRLVEKLLPILKSRGVSAYLSGHDHDLQYIKVQNIDFVVSGGGGRDNKGRKAPAENRCSPAVRNEKGFQFGLLGYGFLEVEADENVLRYRLIDPQGKTLWEAGG